jgi:hypothetical protein
MGSRLTLHLAQSYRRQGRGSERRKRAWRTSIVDLMKALNLDSSLETAADTAKRGKHYMVSRVCPLFE